MRRIISQPGTGKGHVYFPRELDRPALTEEQAAAVYFCVIHFPRVYFQYEGEESKAGQKTSCHRGSPFFKYLLLALRENFMEHDNSQEERMTGGKGGGIVSRVTKEKNYRKW